MDARAADPVVTVVTAIRNQARWVDRCAASVLELEGPARAWVVVDNASTDGTRERLQAWAARDPRVRLLCSEENLVQGAALAWALETIRTPWVAVLDGDDEVLPGRFSRSLAWLAGDAGRLGVYGEARFVDEAGKALPPWFIARDALALRRLGEFSMPAIHSTSTWRTAWLRGAVHPLPRRHAAAYDYLLLTRALAAGEVGWLKDELSLYRIHPEGVSHRNRLGQLADGMAISIAAARHRTGRPEKLDELMDWAAQQTRSGLNEAQLHGAAARQAWSEALPRHALYYARRAVRRGHLRCLLTASRALVSGQPGPNRLWPLLRGGLLAAARVDEMGRSLTGS
jgi:hypothetical protein